MPSVVLRSAMQCIGDVGIPSPVNVYFLDRDFPG